MIWPRAQAGPFFVEDGPGFTFSGGPTLSNLAFNGIPLALVIDKLLLLGGHQLRIILRPSQTRAA
jgi:hypothetical protein